jgi:hypothetical protein
VFWIHDNVQNKRTTSALIEAGAEPTKEAEPSKPTKKAKLKTLKLSVFGYR